MRFIPQRKGAAWLELAAGIGLAFVGAHLWRAQSATRTGATRPGAAVPTAIAGPGSVSETVRVNGTLSALRSATVMAPRVQGNRANVNRGGAGAISNSAGPVALGGSDFNLVLLTLAQPGTHVKAGDMVAQFDTQNQVLRLDDYKDAQVQQDANIKSLLASLASSREAHDQTERAAKAAWDSDVLDEQKMPVLTHIDAELARIATEQDKATYDQLDYEASLVEESNRVQVRLAELSRDQARLELQRAEANVQKMTLRAPMDGIVVLASIVRNGELGQVREGDQVNAGQPFMYIVDPSAMVLDASLNQVDAARLLLGMRAKVLVDAYPGVEMTGTVAGIGAMATDSTFRAGYVGAIPIRVAIDRLDPRIIPDLTGSAEIAIRSEESPLVVPRTALFEENGKPFAYVRSPEGWTKQTVETGVESATGVVIRLGLESGAEVALQRPL
jgi:multidrug efflux pump subunit AcrA (membrane-fusion protein)